MLKDELMGRLVRLAEQCDEQTVLKLCDVLETSLEPGACDVRSIEDFCSISTETEDDPESDDVRATRDSALQLAISGL